MRTDQVEAFPGLLQASESLCVLAKSRIELLQADAVAGLSIEA